jgi:hypothetical protein
MGDDSIVTNVTINVAMLGRKSMTGVGVVARAPNQPAFAKSPKQMLLGLFLRTMGLLRLVEEATKLAEDVEQRRLIAKRGNTDL